MLVVTGGLCIVPILVEGRDDVQLQHSISSCARDEKLRQPHEIYLEIGDYELTHTRDIC